MVDQVEATDKDRKILICMVGLPRSGKSTWCRGEWHPVVNPDSVRLALHGQRFVKEAEPFVWAIVRVMVKSLFLAGHKTVILDATNTTRKAREAWKSSGTTLEDWDTYFKVIPTSKEECIARAIAENDTTIVPIIERMAEQWEELAEDEPRWTW